MNLLSKIKKAAKVLTSKEEATDDKLLLLDVEVLGGEGLDSLIAGLSKVGTNSSNEPIEKPTEYVPHTHKLPEEKKEDKPYVGYFINNNPYLITPEESKYLWVPTIIEISKSKCTSKKHEMEKLNGRPDMPLDSFHEELIKFHDYKVYYKRYGSDEVYTPNIMEKVLITSGMVIRVIDTKEKIPKKKKITYYINGYTICNEVTNELLVTFQDIIGTLDGCYRLSNTPQTIDTTNPQNYEIKVETTISNNIAYWEFTSLLPSIETIVVVEGMRFCVKEKS